MSGFSELDTSVMEQSFNAKLPFGCLHLRPHAELNLCIDHQYQHHGHLGQQLVGLTVTVSKWEFNPEFDSVVNERVYCNTIQLSATSVLDEVAELRIGLADRKQTQCRGRFIRSESFDWCVRHASLLANSHVLVAR